MAAGRPSRGGVEAARGAGSVGLDPNRREPSPPSLRIRERQDPAYDQEAFLRDLERVARRDPDPDDPTPAPEAATRRREAE
jgi:hypothetical protein